jgi:hypothetical protein
MVTKGVSVEDLKNLANKTLAVNVPSYNAMISTRNLVSYVRQAYPLPDGENYATSATRKDDGTYDIVIRVVEES